MKRQQPLCSKRQHDWQPMRRGAREQCTKCADVFPCRHACEHLDCIVATSREMPDWVADAEQAREAMLAELAIIAPTTVADQITVKLIAGANTDTDTDTNNLRSAA